MGHGKTPKKAGRFETSSVIVVALIGLLGTAITAYFGYLSQMRSAELNLSAAETASRLSTPISGINFLPIPEKDLLIKTFNLSGPSPRVNVRFIANNFDLDFNFSAPLNMTCRALVFGLTQHFAFDKHIEVDVTHFSADPNSTLHQVWVLVINGLPVDTCGSNTLRELDVKAGDLLGLKIEWAWLTLLH